MSRRLRVEVCVLLIVGLLVLVLDLTSWSDSSNVFATAVVFVALMVIAFWQDRRRRASSPK
jgi:nicotinamide riboside transporter PnuC